MKGKIKNGVGIMPLGNRVLVDPEHKEGGEHRKMPSGIYVPETGEREKPEQGKVVAVGEGTYEGGKLVPLRIKVGDKVIFSKYGYDEIKVGDKKYFVIKDENVLAVLK